MRISAPDLKELTTSILIAAGATAANAECVALHLVNANLRGVDTHGVWQLPGYVAAIERGELLPESTPGSLVDTSTTSLITANWGFGHVAALEASREASRKAHDSGIAIAGIVQSHHIGRLGEYAELAARQGLLSLIWASGLDPVAVPYGGTKPVFGTNPLAIGLPAGDETPVVIDFATSAASAVKVIEAARKGMHVPSGWLVDKNGNATDDPSQLSAGGGQLAFGGHKGSALMLATEVLGRIFTGADAFVQLPLGGAPFARHGAAMIMFRADLFRPLMNHLEQTVELLRSVRAVSPAPGFDVVMVPGDLENQTRTSREREGIPIPDDLWQTLTELTRGKGSSSMVASKPAGSQ